MANKNKKDDSELGCFLLIVIIPIILVTIKLVQLIPLLTPAILAICAIVYFIKYRVKDCPHIKTNFELSKREKDDLRTFVNLYNYALENIAGLNHIINEEGLLYTKNGRLDLRNPLAKEIQSQMEKYKEHLRFKTHIESMMNLPNIRYKNASKHFSRSWACFLSVIIWLAVVATQSHKEMLKYHQYETAVAVEKVMSVLKHNDNNSSTTSSDDKQNTDTHAAEQQPNDRQNMQKRHLNTLLLPPSKRALNFLNYHKD